MRFFTRFLTAVLILTISGLNAEATRHVKPTADGDLVNDAGIPEFLISTSVKPQVFERNYEKICEEFKGYPQNLYGKGYAPAKFPLFQSIGFNALNFFGTTLSFRVLDPDYRGFRKETQRQEALDFYQKYGFDKLGRRARIPAEKVLKDYDELIENAARIPVYIDLHPGLQAILSSNRNLVKKLLPPEKYFAHPDSHPVFALRIKLSTPEGRAIQKKIYVDEAQHYLALGVKPFVYKLFNEADYKDHSPENYQIFFREMHKKYGTIEALNRAWHTCYASFEEMSSTGGAKAREIEFNKFQERQIADFVKELRDALRSVDPEAAVLSQVHSNAWRASWNNFNQYLINRHTGYVSFGTGNYTFDQGVEVDEEKSFGECSAANSPRESLARAAFYRALADGKPLLTTEAYVAGFGERFKPLKNAFWHEMILGSSMVNLWEWEGHWNPNSTPNVSYMLHHPRCVSPKSWRAVPETLAEMRKTADFFQRRKNRPQPEIAALFSYPTLRANQPQTDGFIQAVNGPLLLNIPTDAIFEEQLAEGRHKCYRVLLLRGVVNVYPETGTHLRQFIEAGGTVISDTLSLRNDEYDFPRHEPLLDGLEVLPGTKKLQYLDESKTPFIDSDFLTLRSPDWRELLQYQGKTLMAERRIGKGSLIVLAGTYQDSALARILQRPLRDLRVNPQAEITRLSDGELLPYISAYTGDSDGMTGWYFANYTTRPQLVQVKAPRLQKADTGVNFIDRESYPIQNGTLVLLLPPLTGQVVMTGSGAAVEKRFGTFERIPTEKLQKRHAEALAKQNRNAYVRPSTPIDLRRFANYGFDNQQGWKTQSAWFDSNGRDLKGVPWHGQIFNHINYELIRFDFNDNKTCIALKSQNLPDAPSKTAEIALNAKLRGVAFLCAVTHAIPGERVMTCRFTYEDGSVLDVPFQVGRELGDWNIDANPPEMRKKCAWKSQNKRGFFQYEWDNPFPSKILRSFSLHGADSRSTPIVVAVSALPTRFRKEYQHRIDLARTMSNCNAAKAGTGIQPDGSIRVDQENFSLRTPDNRPIELPGEKISKAVLRFQLLPLPDQWGNRTALYAYWWGTGLIGNSGTRTNIKTWPDQKLTQTAQALVHATRHALSHEFPIEVELSLATMNQAGEHPFDAVTGLALSAGQQKNRLEIRNLRIEFD